MKKPYRIAVIDYGMSNMFSIENALNMLGLECVVTSDHERIISADGAILPGVGAFPEAMKRIDQFGLGEAIRKFISSGKPFMGICLGMQLLFSRGEEYGIHDGLGLIKGVVKELKLNSHLKLPHVGWNNLVDMKLHPLLKGIRENIDFYFLHSQVCIPEDNNAILASARLPGALGFRQLAHPHPSRTP